MKFENLLVRKFSSRHQSTCFETFRQKLFNKCMHDDISKEELIYRDRLLRERPSVTCAWRYVCVCVCVHRTTDERNISLTHRPS
jgi:hypothetical protein